MDLGSSPTEIVERAMDSRELKHILKQYKREDLVLKVVGREEYMLKEKRISSYKVWVYLYQLLCRSDKVCTHMLKINNNNPVYIYMKINSIR